MSDLRGKLRRAFRLAGDPTSSPEDPGGYAPTPLATPLLEALRRQRERALRKRDPVELPAGQELRNDRGSCWLRRLEYPLTHRHGDHALGAPGSLTRARLAELAREPTLDAAAADCLFLDTETTGLAGGSGTVVFLCGLGFFDGLRFVLEQVLLRAFAEEAAVLAHVARRLAERPALVTFVGKSFDRHRLAARMAVHKIAAPVLTVRHLDLYHASRRTFGKQLPDVRLRTVEEQVLGVERDDDLPGSEAPRAFLDWIRDRSGRLDRVLEHNRLDVLSLVALLSAVGAAR